MTSRSIQALVIVAALAIAGLAIMAYKTTVLGYPLLQEQRSEVWTVEIRATVEGRGDPTQITLALPDAPDGFSLVDREVIAPGFGERVESGPHGSVAIMERRALDGMETVFTLSRFYRVDSDAPETMEKDGSGTDRIEAAQARFAKAGEDRQEAVNDVIDRARERSIDQVGLSREAAGILAGDSGLAVAVAEIDLEGPDLSEPARRLAFVLNVAGIDARRITGYDLAFDRRRAGANTWVEVSAEDGRILLDPSTGLVEDRVISRLTRDDAPEISVEGARLDSRVTSTKRSYTSEIDRALWRGESDAPLLTRFSPTILSVDAQLVFQVLMLLPVGALAIAVLRQLIGIRTFGTFMPVLIALAFRETQLPLGITLFVGVVIIGLVLRSFFNVLHLTLVPRLTAVLSIVTLIMLALAVFGAANDVRLGLSLSLFPIVILTMTIESMSLIWDEYGPKEALTRAGGSLISAIVGYLVISIPVVQHLVFVFPEVLLLVIAAAILLGRYNGFTLYEFLRFRMIRRAP